MLVAFGIFALCVILLLIVAVIYLYPGSTAATTVPGWQPSTVKDGNLPDILKAGSMNEFLHESHAKFGKIFSFYLGESLMISIASPSLFKEIAKVFDRPAEVFMLFEPLITLNCIQFANKADGRRRRTEYDRAYSHDKVQRLYPVFNKLAKDMAKSLGKLPAKEHVPLGRYMFAVTIKAICLGSFGAFFEDDKEVLKLRRAYDTCWWELESRLGGNVVAAHSDRQVKFEKGRDEMYRIVDRMIAQRRASPPEGREHLLIDILLESATNEEELRVDALVYFIAGFHTTANALIWTIYYICRHPAFQDAALEEIRKIGDDDVTADNFSKLDYIRQLIDESLRCSQMAPIAARVQDCVSQLGGHQIPAGTPIIQALGVMSQDPEIWPNPERFDPDRFSASAVKARGSYVFEPFGYAGKRKCPGYRFAYIEITVMLVWLLRTFKFELVPGQEVTPRCGLVTSPKDEIWLTLSRR